MELNREELWTFLRTENKCFGCRYFRSSNNVPKGYCAVTQMQMQGDYEARARIGGNSCRNNSFRDYLGIL